MVTRRGQLWIGKPDTGNILFAHFWVRSKWTAAANLTSGLSNLYNQAKQLFQPTTFDTQEIQNPSNPGDAGYGWRYFSNGVAIDPSGNYYQDGNLVWSPDTTTTDTSGSEG